MEYAMLALVICLSYIWGIRLRYAPFASIIEPPLRRRLITFYILLLVVNFLVLTATFLNFGFRTLMIQINGFLIAAIVILTNRKMVKGHWKEHLFVFGFVESASFLVLSVPVLLVDLGGGFDSIRSYFTGALIYDLLFLALFRPLRNLLRSTVEPFLTLDTGNYWTAVWFLPVGIYFGMVFNAFHDMESMSLTRLISRIFLSVTMLMLCLSIANDHRRMAEQRLTESQLMDQRLHYAQLQTQVEDARKNAHNFMHHVSAIRNLVNVEDLDALRSYCDSLSAEHSTHSHIPYTGNPAVDGVVYRYIQLAREHQIRFSFRGTVRSCGLSDLDLCVLLGNALENALAGCLTVERERQIQLLIDHEGSVLSILVTNTFDGVVRTTDDLFLSRKRLNAPGLGMGSMRGICTRYGGSMQTKWTSERFTLLFLLPAD